MLKFLEIRQLFDFDLVGTCIELACAFAWKFISCRVVVWLGPGSEVGWELNSEMVGNCAGSWLAVQLRNCLALVW